MDKDLKNKSTIELKEIVTELGQKKFCADYIFSFIHAKAIDDIDKITPLAKPFRKKLIDAGFYISTLKTVKKLTDPDSTIKYLGHNMPLPMNGVTGCKRGAPSFLSIAKYAIFRFSLSRHSEASSGKFSSNAFQLMVLTFQKPNEEQALQRKKDHRW